MHFLCSILVSGRQLMVWACSKLGRPTMKGMVEPVCCVGGEGS